MNPVVIIAGQAAAGKTTMARQLAEEIGFSFIDLGSIVRQTTLDFLRETEAENPGHQDLCDETVVGDYLRQLSLRAICNGDRVLEVDINGQKLDIDDPRLRETFLDDRTLVLARSIRPNLIALQREAAELGPVVFSARNAVAFTEEESVRIFINPGMTARVRRRARYEGREYGDLSRQERRNLIRRVVVKEQESIGLGVAMSNQLVTQEGFVLFENNDSVEQSLQGLTELTLRLMTERGWQLPSEKEKVSGVLANPERH